MARSYEVLSRLSIARLPREAMFVALPRKVDNILPRAAERTRTWRVSSQIGAVFVPRQRDFVVLCSFS
jgi:hypothetical protein